MYPIRNGVISEYTITMNMISYFLDHAIKNPIKRILRPDVIVAIPCEITSVEKRAVERALKEAGAGRIFFVDSPLAAAVGAQLDISAPNGKMVVDIGGGITDIAVISLKGVVVSESIKVAGDKFDESIIRYVRNKYNILIGERTAESIKMRIGAVYRHQNIKTMDVKGRCLVQGLPKFVTLSSAEMLEALLSPIMAIIDAICSVIEKTPPELVADIINNGIVMTGGGSLLYGLDRLIAEMTGIRTRVADHPVSCVAIGTGKSLEHINMLTEGTINLSRARQKRY